MASYYYQGRRQSESVPRVRWAPSRVTPQTELRVLRGDLTVCLAHAVVCPINSYLLATEGLARKLAAMGGEQLLRDAQRWLAQQGTLEAGHAAAIMAGALPCRYVVFVVAPDLMRIRSQPSEEDTRQLRGAVWKALSEATRLKLTSIAMPGLAMGSAGYPRQLAAREMVAECRRFCSDHPESSLRSILFMEKNAARVRCLEYAVRDAHARELETFRAEALLVQQDGSETEDDDEEDDEKDDDGKEENEGDDEEYDDGYGPTHDPVDVDVDAFGTGKVKSPRPRHQAAALMPFRTVDDNVEVLLGVEGTHQHVGQITLLGAHVEHGEDAFATASRGFDEGTDDVVDAENWLTERRDARASATRWLPLAEYALVTAAIVDPEDPFHDLPELYANSVVHPMKRLQYSMYRWKHPDEETKEEIPPPSDAMKHVVWVKWRDLVVTSRRSPHASVSTTHGLFLVSPLLQQIVRDCHSEIEPVFGTLLARALLAPISDDPPRLLKYDREELADDEDDDILGDSWYGQRTIGAVRW